MTKKRVLRAALAAGLALGLGGGLAGGAAAGPVLEAGDATVRRNGVSAGRLGALPEGGWFSRVPESATASEYLYFDLDGSPLDPAEGSIVLTIERDERQDHEALFVFTTGEWEPVWGPAVRWLEEPFEINYTEAEFIRNGTRLPRRFAARGVPHRYVLAWKWDRVEMYAGGEKLLPDILVPGMMGPILERARYLVIGAETDPRFPAGATVPLHSKLLEFRVFDTFDGWRQAAHVGSVAAEKGFYGAGQEITVTLRGSIDGTAAFTLAGVAESVLMEEVDDGVYVGSVVVPPGLNLASAALTGTLTDPATGQTATLTGKPVAIDSVPPEPPARVLATAPWAKEIELSWTASASADLDHYLVFRGEGRAPDLTGAPFEELRELALVDTRVVPGLTYHYAVLAVDKAGNRSAPSEAVSVTAVAGDGPAITSIHLEPFGRPLRPGQSVTLAVTGQSGGTLTVDLGELGTGLPLVEQGRTGVYRGTYTVTEADVGPTRGLHRVVAHLSDDYGSASLAGPELAVVGLDVWNDVTPPTLSKASHDGFAAAGFSGRLVAGDVLTVTLEGEPQGYASFDLPGVARFIPMAESPTRPGTYTGTYTVGWSDEGVDLPVLVTLADEAGNETTATAGRPVSLDTRVRLLVSARDSLLPADRKATTRLVAKATNANGDDVSGHELALTLSTTEEYTGVVGGGRLEDRTATQDDVDNVEVRWGGVTDSFGEVAATYTAGFAAKTALILAKNLTTGDVGAGWLHTYVASTVALEILPRAARGTPDRAILRLTADPEWLTADGRSTSRVKAVLTDLAGNPLAGQRVTFALGSDNGRLRVLRSGLTDEQGLAEAEYRAGTLAGYVTLTAASREHGVTAAVQLELRADAPAKIDLVASAQRLVSGDKATLSVTVSDIHDNPNIGVPVTFALLSGSGSLAAPSLLTDRNGQGAVAFTAGSTPGTAVLEARHTSRAPNEDELRRVYGTVFVPRLAPRQERDRVRIVEWLVEPREEVAKGQPLVTLEGGNGTWTLAAPEKGVFVREVKHRRDRVELGDTLGYVEIDETVWQEEYGK
ncbi:MAG: Ig-like domain-containing protein [Thermodesulfobacteriota bacterium]